MPEFGPNGRNAFFMPDPYVVWIQSYRSGFDLRVTDAAVPTIPILWELVDLALSLPLALQTRLETIPAGPWFPIDAALPA